MKRLKTILTARKRTVLIHDPIEALIARMCDPTDTLYDKSVADAQLRRDETSEPR